MGGTIGVVIREEDGKIHKMARWTNPLPKFFRNMKFINKDKKHLEDYLNVFYEMQKDYNNTIANKGDFGLNMADVYVPYSGHVAPIEYGLVVVDYKTEQVLHCQGYGDFDSLYDSEIDGIDFQDNSDKKIIQALINEKRITHIEAFTDVGICQLEIEYKKDTVILKNHDINKDDYYIHGYMLDMSPWKITKFKESKEELFKFKEAIKQLGIEITEEDDKIWDEFINYRYNDEEL